jgi:outer membrane biogenesis lipoprotein LolB
VSRALALALLAAAGIVLAACGEKAKEPKVDADTAKAQAKQEQEEALERARHGPMGAQVQALDQAKALGGQMNDMAEKNLEKADPK